MSELPKTFVTGFHDEAAVRRMTYNPLGQTGLKVSKLSLGTSSFSNIYGDFDEQQAIDTVHEAIKQGINYIDTGYWYGQGKAETILGKALKDVPRQAYYVATKCGRYENQAGTMFDFSADKTRKNFKESLKRLQLDRVDVIQVHDVEFAPYMDRIVNETLPVLEEIVQSGRATYIGITGYPVSTLKECIEKSKTIISTILSYTRLTLIDDTLLQFIPYFQMQGIGVINASGVAMGLLTNKGPFAWHPAPDEIRELCGQASAYCQSKGVELARLAMHFCYNQPGIATNLIGMNTRQLLQSNLDVLQNGLSPIELEVLREIQENFFAKLQARHWENFKLEQYRLQVGGW